MASAIPKQYLPLAGKPVLAHTLERAAGWSSVRGIAVVTQPGDARFAELDASRDNRVFRVDGGSSRAASVLNGLQFIANQAGPETWVLVHDGARPLVRADRVEALCQTVWSRSATGGLLGIAAVDTLKVTSREESLSNSSEAMSSSRSQSASRAQSESLTEPASSVRVEKTLDRQHIWQAQTPQLFRAGELIRAMQKTEPPSAAITDESSAMERAGHTVLLLDGAADNIKITHTADLALANFLLDQQLGSVEDEL